MAAEGTGVLAEAGASEFIPEFLPTRKPICIAFRLPRALAVGPSLPVLHPGASGASLQQVAATEETVRVLLRRELVRLGMVSSVAILAPHTKVVGSNPLPILISHVVL